MTRTLSRVLAATALAAVACVQGEPPPAPTDARLQAIGRALDLRATAPLEAASLLEQAGAGVVLERVRIETWLSCLERSTAAPAQWQALIADGPPADLEGRAQLGLVRALRRAGREHEAVEALESLARSGSEDADAALLSAQDREVRLRSARRLAVLAPRRLAEAGPGLEAEVVRTLSARERLQRAAAWRRAGAARRVVEELARVRFQSELERQRRVELAEAALVLGQPAAALDLVGGGRDASPAELVVRAEAHRRLGWQRYPEPAARNEFARCLSEAVRAEEGGTAAEVERARGLAAECATEAGDLQAALAAWRQLVASGWSDERRGWLGRRLGLALARADTAAAVELAAALPEHERCLSFWAPAPSAERHRRLAELAAAPIADLYGLWARRELGLAEPQSVALGSLREPPTAPSSVRLLLEAGATDEAAQHWLWMRGVRGATPGEAVAAAELEVGRGHQNEAISWLRAAMPELGTVAMARLPEAVLRAYLPLRFDQELLAAARSAAVPPWLLAAVARQESLFVATARSPRGARGVLQLLPETAQPHALALGFGPRPDLNDPAVNLRVGARELASLLRRFGAVEPALAAYNGGEGRVTRWWRPDPDPRRFTEAIPIPETYTYVRRVMFLSEAYRLVYAEVWRRS